MKTVEIVEGSSKLLVPPLSLSENAPPTSPIFFNPAASVNRDVSVAITVAEGAETFCDAMAGVGSRGIRVAKESPEVSQVTLVDINPLSIGIAKRSAKLNGVFKKCKFVLGKTDSYLQAYGGRDRGYDSVDIDPFGSPAGHFQAGVAATADGGLLSVTATDTAALCGVYPAVSLRRYGADPLNNHFHHETGVRIIAGAVSRAAAAVDIGAFPVAAHSTRHYMRVYLRLKVGASKADDSLGNLGHLSWCPGCGDTKASEGQPRPCEVCGRKPKVAGPLWVGPLTESRLLRRSGDAADSLGFRSAEKILRSLQRVDSFPPWSFSIERFCSEIKVPTVPEASVRELLGAAGYVSSRQPFEVTGLKTDAPAKAVKEAVLEASRVAYPRQPSQK